MADLKGDMSVTVASVNDQPSVVVEDTATEKEHGHSHSHHTPEHVQSEDDGSDDEKKTLTRVGRAYKRVLNTFVLLRYTLYMLPVSALIAIPIILSLTKFKTATIANVPMFWFFVWVEIVWNSFWIFKLFTKLLPGLFQAVSGSVSASTRKYYRVIKALEVQISLMGWTVASWLTFLPVMTRNPTARHQHATKPQIWQLHVHNLLAACFVASCMHFGQKLGMQILTVNYHRREFSARIKQSKRDVQLFSLLYEASVRLYPAFCEEFIEDDYIISNSIFAKNGQPDEQGIKKLRRASTNVGTKVAREFGRVGDRVGAIFGQIAQEMTGMKKNASSTARDVVVEALERSGSSEALGRRIFLSFASGSDGDLSEADFVAIMGKDRAAAAAECFRMVDKDGNGDVNEMEMTATATELSHTLKSLARSVHDVQTCVRKLDDIVSIFVFILIVLVFITFIASNATDSLIKSGSSLVLGCAWLFGGTAGEFLNSCVFVFAKHPFDVGDRVDIGNEQLIVEHIDLMFTTFRRVASDKITQVGNAVLMTAWVDNVSRSSAMKDSITVNISYDTSMEDINLLRRELGKFVRQKVNSRDFHSEVGIAVNNMPDLGKLEVQLSFMHKSNWSNETLRALRRTKFLAGLITIMKQIPIYAPNGGKPKGAAEPQYTVAITQEEVKQAVDAAAAKKASKRMVPEGESWSGKDASAAAAVQAAYFEDDQRSIMSRITNDDDHIGPHRKGSTVSGFLAPDH